MYKKTLLSLAIASTLTLTGCLDSGKDGRNGDPDYKINNPVSDGLTSAIFNPVLKEFPVPNDLMFERTDPVTGDVADGTFASSDKLAALDYLDGAATTAQIDIKFTGSMDASSLNFAPILSTANGPVPNPAQNVFLLSIDYPGTDSVLNSSSTYTGMINGDPDDLNDTGLDVTTCDAPYNGLQKLDREEFPGETPTLDLGVDLLTLKATAEALGPTDPATLAQAGKVLDYNNDFRAELISVDGSTDNILRITPLRPLDPKKKYLVVVTNEVTSNGEPVAPSTTYFNLRDPNQLPGASSLVPVRDAILGWEKLATGYWNKATNLSRASANLPALTGENIALSYTFTTQATDDVLHAGASAANFFYEKSLVSTSQKGISCYLATKADEFDNLDSSTQYATLKTVAGTAVATADAALVAQGGLKGTAAGTAAVLKGTFGAEFQDPEARSVDIYGTTRAPSNLVNPNLTVPGIIVQGEIDLPYYLHAPSDADPTNLAKTWTASAKTGSAIDMAGNNGEDTNETPPTDKVTYRFPFPSENSTVKVPLLFSVPDPTHTETVSGFTCAQIKGAQGGYNLVIYQHGIFGNRSHSMALANQLGGKCFVTVAMDLPLHGIAPALGTGETGETDPSLGLSVDVDILSDPGTIKDSLLPAAERHFGWGLSPASTPVRMVYSLTDATPNTGYSGQYFINPSNPAVSRSILRQSSIDLLNLNASLPNLATLDLDGDGLPNDLSVNSKIYFIGHSLGGIVGTTYTAVNNGEGVTDPLLGNEAGITNPVTTRVGSIKGIEATALVTTGGGIMKLLENSPSIGASPTGLLAKLEAGSDGVLAPNTSSLETYLNIAQAALDSADPLNYTDSLIASSTKVYINEIYGDGMTTSTQDQTIPVAADESIAGSYTAPIGAANPVVLAGTEALINGLDAETMTTTGALTGNIAAVRFEAGTHNTIIKPEDATQQAIFAHMATNIISFFASDGAAVQNADLTGDTAPNDTFIKQSEPSPEAP